MTDGDRWLTFGMFGIGAISLVAALIVWKEYDQPVTAPQRNVIMGPESSPAVIPVTVIPKPVIKADKIEERPPVEETPPQPAPTPAPREAVSIDVEMHRERPHRAPAHKKHASKEHKLKRDWERAQSNFPLLFSLRN